MRESSRIISSDVDFVTLLLQKNMIARFPSCPRVTISGILHIGFIIRPVQVPYFRPILTCRETEIVGRSSHVE